MWALHGPASWCKAVAIGAAVEAEERVLAKARDGRVAKQPAVDGH